MKKVIVFLSVAVVLLSACGNDKDSKESTKTETKNQSEKTEQSTKKDTAKSDSSINEEKLQEFVMSLYQADKIEDVRHADTLLTNNVQSIVYRQFQSASQDNAKNLEKSVSKPKLYKGVEDDKTYLATTEIKVKNRKSKDISWKQKTMKIDIKGNKVSGIEQVGEREIFNAQN